MLPICKRADIQKQKRGIERDMGGIERSQLDQPTKKATDQPYNENGGKYNCPNNKSQSNPNSQKKLAYNLH